MAAPIDTPIGTITAEHSRPGGVRLQVVAGPKFLYALFTPHDEMHAVSRAFMTFVRDGELPRNAPLSVIALPPTALSWIR